MKKVADGSVTTIEGLPESRQELWADVFADKGAVQCGFCTPGAIMRTKAFLDSNPEPTEKEIQAVSSYVQGLH